MGHTNSTANLSLPQFIGTDKPTWLGDVNGAFSAIDSYAGTNDAAVAAAVSDASSAVSQAAAAVNTANTANTTAGNASTAANNAIGVANTANAIAGTVDAKVGLLADLHTTDRTSIVNAINEVKDAEGDLTTLTTTDKTSLVAAINEVAGSVSGLSVIATAAANQTYAAQLADLESAYNNLTTVQKMNARIKTSTGVFIADNVAGSFTRHRVDAANYSALTLNLTSHKNYAVTITTGTTTLVDESSNTNTVVMELYA